MNSAFLFAFFFVKTAAFVVIFIAMCITGLWPRIIRKLRNVLNDFG